MQTTQIGQIETIEGHVEITRADGTVELGDVGDAIYLGDAVATWPNASVAIVFADESIFSLGEFGQVVIDEMIYDAEEQSGEMSLSMLSGTATFISGFIAKTDPNAMMIDTPVGSIGIRGTQVGININEAGETTVVLMEEIDGFVGEIVVSNNAGVQVINQANLSTLILTYDTLPTDPVALDELILAEFDKVREEAEFIAEISIPELQEQDIPKTKDEKVQYEEPPQIIQEPVTKDEHTDIEELAVVHGPENVVYTNTPTFLEESRYELAVDEVESTQEVSPTPEPEDLDEEPIPDPMPDPVPDPEPIPEPEPTPEPEPELTEGEQIAKEYFEAIGLDATLVDGNLVFGGEETNIKFDDELTSVLEGLVDTIDLSQTEGDIQLNYGQVKTISDGGNMHIIGGEGEVDLKGKWDVGVTEEGYTTFSKGDDVITLTTDG